MAAILALGACRTSGKKPDLDELCHSGEPKSCVQVYKQMTAKGPTPESEKFLLHICQMPQLVCQQIQPTDAVAMQQALQNSSDELLYSEDVWQGGAFAYKQLIFLKLVSVAPHP